MTKKELWLNLYHTNDIALATAIYLCENADMANPDIIKGIKNEIEILNKNISKK